jgi:hypothetical protein
MRTAGCDAAIIIMPPNQATAVFSDLANLTIHLKATFGPAYKT